MSPRKGGFTILESVIVLAILAVFTMVLFALMKHDPDSEISKSPPVSEREPASP